MRKVLKAGWLVGAAARKAMGGAMMAAALVLGMTACSSDDGVTESGEPQAAAPQAVSTVHVTVGAGIGDNSGAKTRSNVVINYEGKRMLVFTAGDRLFVSAFVDDSYFVAGTLSIVNSTISEDGREASFSGDLKVYQYVDVTPVPSEYAFETDDPLNECEYYNANLIPKDMSNDCYTIEDYWILQFDHSKSIVEDNPEDESDDCVSTLMKTAIKVSSTSYKIDDYGEGPKMFRQFGGSPILNCEISGLTGGTAYTVTVLSDGNESNYNNYISTDYNLTYATPVTADGNGTARFAIGLKEGFSSGSYWTLKFESISGETRYLKLGMRDAVDSNKAYRVSGTATTATGRTIDLSQVSGDVTLHDGDVLTGELSGEHKISIAAGATVTLNGARIPGRNVTDNSQSPWAGITCLGDATIVLAEGTENYVKGYNCYYPGIQAGPAGATKAENSTLTISGTGTLTAETGLFNPGWDALEGLAAGIGGGRNQTVGNIRIEGGTIIARGNEKGAGIGSGYAYDGTASCGDITITGGTVTATGGLCAAGIGSGRNVEGTNSCGDITITGGKVEATGGEYAAGIGSGMYATCGNITIDGTVTGMAMGGEYSSNDIGAGKFGSCGTVSMAAGTISGIFTAACTLKVTIEEDNGYVVSNKTCTNITISDGTRSFEFSGDDVRFDNLTKAATLNFSLRGSQTSVTLTVTGTGGGVGSDTYSATNTFNIYGSSCDLGTVNLVKQQ